METKFLFSYRLSCLLCQRIKGEVNKHIHPLCVNVYTPKLHRDIAL